MNNKCPCALLSGIKSIGFIISLIGGIAATFLFYLFFDLSVLPFEIIIYLAFYIFVIFIIALLASERLLENSATTKNSLRESTFFIMISIAGSIITSILGLSIVLTSYFLPTAILVGICFFFFLLLITSMFLIAYSISRHF